MRPERRGTGHDHLAGPPDVALSSRPRLRASDAVAQKALQCLAALAEACYAAEHRPNRKAPWTVGGGLWPRC